MFQLSNSQLKKFIKEWTDPGRPVEDMGYLGKIEGVRETVWSPNKFYSWLMANKHQRNSQKVRSINIITFNQKTKENENVVNQNN